MEARRRKNDEFGCNITAHHAWGDNSMSNKVRDTNTFKSQVPFGANPRKNGTSLVDTYANEIKAKQTRDRQFTNNPVQPGATRQSYQDSDIFATKGDRETVQRSSMNYKGVKPRDSNTFARSNVIGTDEAAVKPTDHEKNMGMGGDFGKHHITRQEKKWESNVFSGAKPDPVNRKYLGGKKDAGKGGLWGEAENEDDYRYRKTENWAGAISQKEHTRPVKFNEMPAEDRKIQELYGKSQYNPNKRQDYRPQTAKNPTHANPDDVFSADQRKARKVNEFQSNILTHQDEGLRDERNKAHQFDGKRIGMASNSSWNAQGGYQQPTNAGRVDAYKYRQNQLTSNVLEQTDYSNYAPIQKKQLDLDNLDSRKAFPISPNKKKPQLQSSSGDWYANNKEMIRKDYTDYNAHSVKQNMLQSNLDGHGYDPSKQDYHNGGRFQEDEYKEKFSRTIPAKNHNQETKLKNLSSTLAGHDANKYYQNHATGETIDFVLDHLPSNIDKQRIREVAGVKHVISADFNIDNLRGIATGEGRVKIRLNEEENADKIRLNFLKAGYSVKDHKIEAKKKPIVTGPGKDIIEGKNLTAKEKKAFELQTKNPTAFGNHENYNELDMKRLNKLNAGAKDQFKAMNQWSGF